MELTYCGQFSGTTFAGVSVSAAQDLFYILTSATVPVRLKWIAISASGQSSPVELVVVISRYTATVTAGSGGTSVTVRELSQYSSRAASSTVRANDTTRASTTGTKEVLWPITMQVTNGWEFVPIPETFPYFLATQACIVGLEVAPSATTLYGAIGFGEVVG